MMNLEMFMYFLTLMIVIGMFAHQMGSRIIKMDKKLDDLKYELEEIKNVKNNGN